MICNDAQTAPDTAEPRSFQNPEEPARVPARRGCSLTYKNKTLLSTIDPVEQAERIIRGIVQRERTLYFCPSPLFGYGLELFISLLPAGSALLCVETDRKLMPLSLSSITATVLEDPRFMLSGESTAAGLCSLVRTNWGSRTFRRVEVIKLSGGWQLDGERYERLADALRGELAVEWGNAMTLVKLGRRYTRNALRNIALLGRAEPLEAAAFGAKPVLVLGAGPSLDPVLDGLGRAGLFREPMRRAFAIVCADTCLTVLREWNIRPDLAVILESQFWNLRDFGGSRNSGIPAALDLSVFPATAEILGGPVYFFCTPWTKLRLFDRLRNTGLLPAALPPLGSVGLSAVELARRLGSGPIVTAGIDFSFSLDQAHARSAPGHLASLASRSRFTGAVNAAAFRSGVFDTLSKSQIPVKSDPAMRTYRGLFEREFSGDRRIRDIEGTGLFLGLDTLTLAETAALLAPAGGPQPNPGTGNSENAGGSAERHNASRPELEEKCRALQNFMHGELYLLEKLKSSLTGKIPADAKTIEILLDELDYLWAHFPDCAGSEGRRPPASDLGFLKRVRTEIDPFLKLWKHSERETNL